MVRKLRAPVAGVLMLAALWDGDLSIQRVCASLELAEERVGLAADWEARASF